MFRGRREHASLVCLLLAVSSCHYNSKLDGSSNGEWGKAASFDAPKTGGQKATQVLAVRVAHFEC